MRIHVRERFENGVVLTIEGDLYGGPHADDFYRIISEVIEEGRTTVLVDLARVKRANSSGLGILIRGYATLKGASGVMRVFNLSDNVDHMFKITRFNSIIEVYETEEEARHGLV